MVILTDIDNKVVQKLKDELVSENKKASKHGIKKKFDP